MTAQIPGWFTREVTRRLKGVKRAAGVQHYARCPAHDDKHASLAIRPGDKLSLIYFCHAGCTQEDVRDALADLGIPDEHLGVYGTPEYQARHAAKASSAEQRKLDRIRGLLGEKLTPAMLRVNILAVIEGIYVPKHRKEFLDLAERAGVGQTQRYQAWAQVSGAQVFSGTAQPGAVSADHVVLTHPDGNCQLAQVNSDVRFSETEKPFRKPENGQNGTAQVRANVRFPETGKKTVSHKPDDEALMNGALGMLADAGLISSRQHLRRVV